jgi:hypothetical protein
VDNAPINNAIPGGVGLAVNGDDSRSDPSDLDRDEGPNLLDIRHNFNGSIVYTTVARTGRSWLDAVLNNNQLGVLLQINSGLPFNIRGGSDLNGDGIVSDRPLFVGRNSMYLPGRFNVDMRYSRLVPLAGGMRAEVIGEFKNIFNTEQTSTVSSVVQVDAFGNPLSPLPTDASGFVPTAGYEQRQFQLGFRFRF